MSETGAGMDVTQFGGDREHKERIVEKYLRGEPEEIYSKLAVEPVLRWFAGWWRVLRFAALMLTLEPGDGCCHGLVFRVSAPQAAESPAFS